MPARFREHSGWMLPLLALLMLAAAWATFLIGRERAGQLDVSGFGPCEDVPEALARDGYTTRYQLPYAVVCVVIVQLAAVPLVVALALGRAGCIWFLVLLGWGASTAILVLGLVVVKVFAG